MPLRLVISPEAECDLKEAYQWYEEQVRGLGKHFISSIDSSFSTVQRHPHRYPTVYKHIRRTLAKHFPYAVFYIVDKRTIIVLAVLHQARNSLRWEERMIH